MRMGTVKYPCPVFVSKFDTHKQRKRDFNLGKNILRELKNILAELFSTGEIDRIDEIK